MHSPKFYDNERGGAQPLPRVELDSVTLLLMGATGTAAIPGMVRGQIPQDERNPIWVVNTAARVYSHNLAWNTHDLRHLCAAQPDMKFYSFYKEYDRPVVTLRPYEDLKTLIYPIKEIVEFWQEDYFFGALPYMMAYAGWCGAKTYRIYGADFDYADRNFWEAGRCCAEYWLGRLRQAGCRLEFPQDTTLRDTYWRDKGGVPVGGLPFGAPLYGYFDNQPKVVINSAGKMEVQVDHHP